MDRHPGVTLRPAHSNDVAVMAALSRELIEAGLTWRYTPSRITKMITATDIDAVVADEAGRVSGFAVMQFGDESGHLVLLCVAQPMQRRGIASSLMQWLLESAGVAGLETIGVEMRADNQAARSFYLAKGFSENTLVPDYYASGIDARKMLLRLRDNAPR